MAGDRTAPLRPELTRRADDRVLKTVAAAEGTDAAGIRDPPLYEVVDTTAIEDGFFGREVAGERRDTVGGVHFQYRGFRVTVRSDGWVQVAEPVEMEG